MAAAIRVACVIALDRLDHNRQVTDLDVFDLIDGVIGVKRLHDDEGFEYLASVQSAEVIDQ